MSDDAGRQYSIITDLSYAPNIGGYRSSNSGDTVLYNDCHMIVVDPSTVYQGNVSGPYYCTSGPDDGREV